MALLETSPASASVSLGKKYEIFPSAPAPGLNSPTAAAYGAVDRNHGSEALVALVCEPGVPPRLDLFHSVAALQIPELTNPVAWGVVDWPPRRRRCFAFIIPAPGERIVVEPGAAFTPFGEDEVLNGILPSLTTGLRALSALGITHRAIRPTNLYCRGTERKFALGECLSAPPASAQPIALEPVESALAAPVGRGAGTVADDLYALGATLIILLLGRDPCAGMDPQQLIAEKIARGSFATLLNGARLPLRAIELVRGLLADDPRERWTLQEFEAWVEHRRLPVKQFATVRRAGRSLAFGGAEHVTARSLACALVREPGAAQFIRTPDMVAWLQRSLGDAECCAAVAAAMTEVADASGGARDARLVARVASALDPRAPLRYRDFAAMLDGMGPMLAAAFRSGGGAPLVAEVLLSRLPQFWFALQGDQGDQGPLLKSFDKLRLLLEDRRSGFGLERVLYELNPGLHCLSPAIEQECVIEPADLLPALERAVAEGRLGQQFIDRHVAAFVAARCKQAGTDWLNEMGGGDPQLKLLGTIHLLARLEGLGGGDGKVPALSERLAPSLPTLVERYRSRTRRAQMSAALARLSGRGSLRAIADLLDAPGEQRRDEAEFRSARGEWVAIERALNALRNDAPNRPRQAQELGAELGVMVAIVMGSLAALGSLLVMG